MSKLISFFGTIGSGKTSRAKLLSDFFSVPFYSEIADSPFLKDTFINKKNALLNQLHFLYRDRNQILEKYDKKNNDILIFDYHIVQVDIFSKLFLNSAEYKEFSGHFQEILNQLPIPDLIIFLEIDPGLNLSRIESRNVGHEKILNKNTIKFMNEQLHIHLERLKTITKVLCIDASLDIRNSIETRLQVLTKMVHEIRIS